MAFSNDYLVYPASKQVTHTPLKLIFLLSLMLATPIQLLAQEKAIKPGAKPDATIMMDKDSNETAQQEMSDSQKEEQASPSPRPEFDAAIFAGGCFWCMEPPFDKVKGVVSTISGYTGGQTVNPSYSEVTGKDTGHYEAIKIVYRPAIVSYEELLEVFWANIDPLDPHGQFCDKGPQYRSAIFVSDMEKKKLVELSIQKAQKKLEGRGKIVTKVLPVAEFYDAEEYHQDYYIKNKLRYRYYRNACGRDKRLQEVWEGF